MLSLLFHLRSLVLYLCQVTACIGIDLWIMCSIVRNTIELFMTRASVSLHLYIFVPSNVQKYLNVTNKVSLIFFTGFCISVYWVRQDFRRFWAINGLFGGISCTKVFPEWYKHFIYNQCNKVPPFGGFRAGFFAFLGCQILHNFWEPYLLIHTASQQQESHCYLL